MKEKIASYIRKWESQGYPNGIPDQAPVRLEHFNKVPSYRLICKAIVKNDVQLETLGFGRLPCSLYHELKRLEMLRTGKVPKSGLHPLQLRLF